MSKAWPRVALGEVLRHRKEFVTIDDLATYRRPRVQLHAQGVVLRDEVPGALIKTKRQQVCRAGEFLVAEIDAKHGGYGIVSNDLDGAIVSSHYFLFEVDESRLNRAYLGYFSRTAGFREQVEAQGSTNYAAIRPSQVLDYSIPLASLAEQEQVVAGLKRAEARFQEMARLRYESHASQRALVRTILRSGAVTVTPMRDLGQLKPTDVIVQPNEVYAFAGVYSFGRGVFASQRRRGCEFAYTRLTRVSVGDFTYPKLMAWEGAFGIVPQECDGCVVSPEFPVLRLDQSRVLPEVVEAHFHSSRVWDEIGGASMGTNARRRRLQPADFLAYEFPLPDRDTQFRLQRIKRQLAQASRAAVENEHAAMTLLPALLDRAFAGAL